MKLYNFLDLKKESTQKDIKKAYYKLAKIYHPDKKTGNELMFKKIKSAYDILSDIELRTKYDKTLNNNETPYDLLQDIIKKFELNNVENIINIIYDKNKFKNDFNDFNFYKIFKNIKFNIFKNKESLNIYKDVTFTFNDIYNNKFKIINVNNNSQIIYPEIYYEELIFKNMGFQHNNINGDLIINIVIENNDYDILDNYDILYKKKNINKLLLPNDDIINITHNTHIVDNKFYILKNKGLINNENIRGNLYIPI